MCPAEYFIPWPSRPPLRLRLGKFAAACALGSRGFHTVFGNGADVFRKCSNMFVARWPDFGKDTPRHVVREAVLCRAVIHSLAIAWHQLLATLRWSCSSHSVQHPCFGLLNWQSGCSDFDRPKCHLYQECLRTYAVELQATCVYQCVSCAKHCTAEDPDLVRFPITSQAAPPAHFPFRCNVWKYLNPWPDFHFGVLVKTAGRPLHAGLVFVPGDLESKCTYTVQPDQHSLESTEGL